MDRQYQLVKEDEYNKWALENIPSHLNSNQWLVDQWWTVHPGHRTHPMVACFSDVYVFEKITIQFIQHFGQTWFVDPPENVNIVMGRVIGKIFGVKQDVNDGTVKTTGLDPNYHYRRCEVLESEIPLVYAVEVQYDSPTSPDRKSVQSITGWNPLSVGTSSTWLINRLRGSRTPSRQSIGSEDSLTPSMISYLERAEYWGQYDYPPREEQFACELVVLEDSDPGESIDSSENRFLDWLEEAYSLGSGSSVRRRKFGLK